MTQSADLLAAAGKALCGPDEWRAPFAHMLGVNPRTMRNWLEGKSEPDRAVLQRAHHLLVERQRKISAAVKDFDAFLK